MLHHKPAVTPDLIRGPSQDLRMGPGLRQDDIRRVRNFDFHPQCHSRESGNPCFKRRAPLSQE